MSESTDQSPVTALARAVRQQPGRPLITWYGPSPARAELSVASFANGVAKTAGLLRDELLLEPGDLVQLDLGIHWQTSIWLAAAAATGCHLRLSPLSAGTADADTVVGFDVDQLTELDATNRIVVSEHPLGLPGPPPGGDLIDHARDALGQPDVYQPDPRDSAQFRLDTGPGTRRYELADISEAAAALCRRQRIGPGDAVLTSRPPTEKIGWLLAWPVPVLCDATGIWCDPDLDHEAIAVTEGAMAIQPAGNLTD